MDYLGVITTLLLGVGLQAQESTGGGGGWPEWLADNSRLAIDLSYRGALPSTSGKPTGVGAVGFDLHKVFSGERRDFGTFVAQGYLLRHDNATRRPGFIEHEDDWDWTWRILSFNLTALSDGEFNVEAGHLELPYGLEQVFDTNGTIRDYRLGPDLGVKADWGVGVNGVLPSFDYRVTLTRGSGMEYRADGEPYAVCGRIATPSSNRFALGVSGFHGEIGRPGAQVGRSRFALDAQYQLGAFSCLGEVSTGDDDGAGRTQAIFEVDWFNTDETQFVYLQEVSIWNEVAGSTDSYHRLALGVQYRPDSHWDLSAELRQDLEPFGSAERVFAVVAQLRFRF